MIPDADIAARDILPYNEITDRKKYEYLLDQFDSSGWDGRPVVVIDNANEGYLGLTGSHRIAAAKEAEIDVPAIIIPNNDDTVRLYDAKDDYDRAMIADELAENGVISRAAADLIIREADLDEENAGVPYDQQLKYSDRETDVPDARTLLSNALLTAAQSDVERKRLTDYQAKIETMNTAQSRLAELNAEIHSMTFTKGKRDTARLRELQDEQVQLRNRINNYDKQLLRLEASTPLQRVVEEEKRKAVRKVREKTAEKLEQLADRRESRDLREKIKRIRDDFQKRLFQGNERTHIPQALVNGVIDICEAIDPTTNTTLMVRRTDANGRILYSEKTHRPLYRKAEKGEFTEAEIEAGLKDGSLRMFGAPQQERYRSGLEALSSLRSAYEDLKNSNDTDLSTEFKAEFAERIGDLAAAIGMTPLRDMTRLQLEDVYNVLSDLRHMVMNAKKQIGTARAIANYEVVQNIIANMRDVKSRKLTTGKVGSFFRDWMTNPVRAVRELTGFDENAELTRLIMDFVEGQRKGDIFSMNAHKKFEALQTGKNRKLFRNAVEKPFNFGLKDVDGKPLKISKMQAMQILLTYERETLNANRRHLSTNIYDL